MTIKAVLTKKLADPLFHVWTSVFLDVIGFSILFPFLPRFLLDRGASLPMIGFYLSINAFIGFFTGIIWGRLSDRFGRRPILIICRIGAIAGYILLALSSNLSMLLIARIVDGIFSRSVPVTLTVVGDIVHPERRSNEMSKIGIAWIVGGLVGPALGAILSVNGFGLIGIFCAALSLTALIISLLTLKESKAQDSVHGTADKTPTQAKQPVFSLALLRQHNPAIMLGQNLFVFLAHFTFSTTMTLYITRQLGLSIAQIGGVFTTIGVINLLGRVTLFPLVLGRLRDRKTYTLGLIIYLAAFALADGCSALMGVHGDHCNDQLWDVLQPGCDERHDEQIGAPAGNGRDDGLELGSGKHRTDPRADDRQLPAGPAQYRFLWIGLGGKHPGCIHDQPGAVTAD